VHEASNAGGFRGGQEIARAADHDPLELLAPALPDRNEMNDGVGPVDCPRQALGIGHIALDELTAPGRELGSPRQIADEAAHGQIAAP
jgi:hypothetical protein